MITEAKWLEELMNNGIEIEYILANTYNPETHDLVEKREAKVARLGSELEDNKSSVMGLKSAIHQLSKELSELEVLNGKILEELKELED